MTPQDKTLADDSVRAAREAIQQAQLERGRIQEALERSRRVRARALPALRRAGFVR